MIVFRTSLVALSVLALPQGKRPPSAADTAKLIQRYLNADSRHQPSFATRQEILDRLELVPALTPLKAKDWTRRIFKLIAKGQKLPKKSGRHYFYAPAKKGRRKPKPSEMSGLFLVGGQLKRPKGLLIAMHGGGAGENGSDRPKAPLRRQHRTHRSGRHMPWWRRR